MFFLKQSKIWTTKYVVMKKIHEITIIFIYKYLNL